MTYFEIIELFTFYGVDVAVLGIVTCFLTQLLKTTLLKNAPNKLYAFLPVIIGCVLYLIYTMLAYLSFSYAFANFAYVLEKGFSVGAAATVVYVVYEQFKKGKFIEDSMTVSVVSAIIADVVEAEKLNTVAKNIADTFDESDLQSSAERISVTLFECAPGDCDKQSIEALSALIAATLARIKKTAP